MDRAHQGPEAETLMERKPDQLMIRLIIVLMATIVCSNESHGQRKISKQDAIILAQGFIQENGYTSDTTGLRRKSIQLESLEFADDIDTILMIRYNSLSPLAYAGKVIRGRWHIGFETLVGNDGETPKEKIGRVVVISGNAKKIKVEHQSYRIDALKD